MGTVKQVLFCGFQRKRKPTLAIRKICVFGEFGVRKQKLCASGGTIFHTEYTELTEIIQ